MENPFAVLAVLDDDDFFADAQHPLLAEGGQCTGASRKKSVKRTRASKATSLTYIDMTVKRLVVAPVFTNVEEIAFPPIRITTIQQAKRAAMMRLGGSFDAKRIVYGTYADGCLQV